MALSHPVQIRVPHFFFDFVTLSLSRVIKLIFTNLPCSLTRNKIRQYKELGFHSSLRWKIILPILTTSLMHFCLKSWDKLLFELGNKKINVPLISKLPHIEPEVPTMKCVHACCLVSEWWLCFVIHAILHHASNKLHFWVCVALF